MCRWNFCGLLILVMLLAGGCAAGDSRGIPQQIEQQPDHTALPQQTMPEGSAGTIDIDAALRDIAALDTPGDVDAAVFAELKAELARVLWVRDMPARQAAAASGEEVFKPADVHLRVDHPGRGLRWLYELKGDYDQNGEVNAADLVPLAFRLGIRGQEPGSNFPFASREGITDGNGDGEINISDVTPIGMNYGRRAEGYAVYGSEALADYPFDFSDLSQPPLATVGQEQIVVEAGKQGYFELDLSGELRSFYWVRLIEGGSPGDPSFIARAGEVLERTARLLPPYRQHATQLQYGTEDGSVSWRYVFMGDPYRIGECNVSAVTVIAATFGQSGTDYIMNGNAVDPDCNRDGVVDFDDVNTVALLLNSAYDGYRLYYAESAAGLPDGYWGEENLEPVLDVEVWEARPLDAETVVYSTELPFTPASGSYLYLRPYDFSGNLGPVCEFVEVE